MAEMEYLPGGIRERMEDLRNRRKLTLKELSEKTGIDYSTLSRIENGNVKKVGDDVLLKLLRFNLNRKTDCEIWEWLHEKSELQTLSMNAFLIEGQRKLMAQEANEKPLDVRALAEELCREMRTQRLFVLPEGESPESMVKVEEEIPADILDFANSF